MTFISNSKKFIFVHLHKCAGSSIEVALSDTIQWNDIILGSTQYGEKIQTVYREKFNLYKHSSAADIEKVVGDNIWNSYFTFSIVRHPLDRMVSLYTFLQKLKIQYGFIDNLKLKTKIFLLQNKKFPITLKDLSIQKEGMTLRTEMWALLESRNFSQFIFNIINTNSPSIKSQFESLLNKDKTKIGVDYIGKFENIENDWQYICKKLNITIDLPHVNKSREHQKNWRNYYTLDDINFMVEKYKVDLEAFNYSV
ncbi:hypothetical protein PCC7424_5861 (plasmid) [Gloeothece citriformis PCC 7424]|uniref:Sulfotransferase family protein n=1 Tax=Gloeothece citriformis (strain PCC 7424) TaxID=65393 RepID=B7KM88_GLOC7|nr:sulfotransferase family 2 domain-containing protein [Gloeothece citriformis]ACK73910.1 hypothetical protein PCC7424_5861 [Gloeothece citriformis PCC 7424]